MSMMLARMVAWCARFVWRGGGAVNAKIFLDPRLFTLQLTKTIWWKEMLKAVPAEGRVSQQLMLQFGDSSNDCCGEGEGVS